MMKESTWEFVEELLSPLKDSKEGISGLQRLPDSLLDVRIPAEVDSNSSSTSSNTSSNASSFKV